MIVPHFDASRVGFLKLALKITSMNENCRYINTFLENLIVLLSKSEENMVIFRKNFGFKQAILKMVMKKMILENKR